MYIKTIPIAKQSGAEQLVQAFAAALAEELGWELSEDGLNVFKHGTKAGFKFSNNSTNVYAAAIVGGLSCTTVSVVVYSASQAYCLDIVRGAETVAVGIRKSSDSIRVCSIIAENANGELKALNLPSSSSSKWTYLADGNVEALDYNIAANTSHSPAVSLIKAPDIYGGCMFKNLYIVLSNPFSGADQTFYIDGKYYRFLSWTSSYGGFAVEIEAG